MNLLDAIHKQISVLDYENCWSPELPPASYERFVSYLSVALQKQLPADVTNFTIAIQAGDTNRVHLRGKFFSGSIRYSLHGDIVYLPGMDTFRGRPGFNRCLDHTFEMNQPDKSHSIPRRSLQELAGAVFLESQDDSFPKAFLVACRQALSHTVNELRHLAGDAKDENKELLIRRCVELINQANHDFGDCIDTELREELTDLLLEISLAAGLEEAIADRIDEWRDW